MMYSPTQLPSSRFPPGQAVGKKLEVRTAGPPWITVLNRLAQPYATLDHRHHQLPP